MHAVMYLPDCLLSQADGGELAAAITAASAALADAGIELLDILPACTVVSSSPGIGRS